MLTLLLFPQPAQTQLGNVNMATVAGDLWPSLNANGPADAIFWTEAQIYQWLDEAAKRLARKSSGFVRRYTALTAASSTANYSLPADHVVTLQADLAGTVLKARNIQEMEALSGTWPTDSGTPKAFLEDTQGVKQLTLSPIPTTTGTIGLFERYTPATVNAANAILEVPGCLREYFTFYALSEARGTKESNAPMLEISQWMTGLCGQIEQLAATYWGDL